MEVLDINHILGREQLASSLVNSVNEFFHKRESLSVKRGYYVYGSPGSGKSEFVCRTLKKAGFDVVKYDAGDVRNKNVIESINKNQMGDSTIMSLWNTKRKRIVIVMDEIDGMNNGDKGGINALIKLIRPKKTKKQQSDQNTGKVKTTARRAVCMNHRYSLTAFVSSPPLLNIPRDLGGRASG